MNIYEIAERCGVSIATVSRVINGSGPVGKATKEKVLRVIEETGFTPNSFARGLNFNSMRLIGVLCTDFGDPFYSQAIAYLEEQLRSRGFHMLLVCTGYTVEGKKRGLVELVNKNVDAIVLIGTVFKENDNSHIEETARKVPVFMVNSTLDAYNVYSVKCDEERAAEQAVSALLDAGYRKPLYLHSQTWYGNADKIRGYCQALKGADYSVDEDLIVKVDSSADAVVMLLAERLETDKDAFDAVFTANDVLAAYALKALEHLGVSKPIIGFNNSPLAELVTPELSSVDNMLAAMCHTIADRVVDVLHGKQPPKTTILSGSLIRRATF